MPLNDLTDGAGRAPRLDVTQVEIVTTRYLDEDQPRIPVPLGGGRLLVSRRYLERIQGALLDIPVDVASEPSATVWLDGPPPADAGWVWREGRDEPVLSCYFDPARWSPGGMWWADRKCDPHDGQWKPWGDARWAPIPRPDHNPKS